MNGFKGGAQFRVAMRNMARAVVFFSATRDKRENVQMCFFKEKFCVF